MPARKRKKPPDPSSFALQSPTCLALGHSSDLSCASLCFFSPILALGKRFGLVPESLRSFARPSAEVLAGLGVCLCNRLRVATFSVFGYRPSPNYCVLTGPISHGLRSRVTCIRSKVSIAIWLEVVLSRNRTFDSYGKGVLGGCLFSRSCEVWPSLFLIFWLSLFLGELPMLFWQYVCWCCWWKFLFAMSLSYYASRCDSSPCGIEFSCLWWVSLSQTGIVIYFPTQLDMFIISFWMHLLGSGLLHYLLIKGMYAAISRDPAVMVCVQHLGLAAWVRIMWVLNPKWTLCFLMFWSIIPLCFVSLVLRLGYWGSVLLVCTAYVEVYERSWLFPSLSLPVYRLLLVLQWLIFRSLLFLPFDPGSCCKPQRVWARQLLYLNAMFLYGTPTTKSLMRLFTEHAEARFVLSVNWAPPSLLLSLLLVISYAQNHDSKCYCFCWHLVHFQNEWDEVKGLRPLVYEDSLSEARICSTMGFCLIHVVSYILYCWHTPFFQPDWNAEQGQWPLFM